MRPKSYRIKTFTFSNGERYCLLINTASGLPLHYPNLFITTQVRNRSLSVAAMESALTSINVLLTFCDDLGIDLEVRFRQREFLAGEELDAIRDYCQTRFAHASNESSAPLLSDHPQNRRARTVGLATEYVRLTHIAQYLQWLAETLLTKGMDRSTALQIKHMHTGCVARRPRRKGRNQVSDGKGLSKDQLATLLAVMQPGAAFNPFDDPAIQLRNRLIVLLLTYLGIRGGELLNIRISDIDWSTNQIVIARRSDEKADPRINQPRVKTLDRRIPIKDTLANEIHQYVVKVRNKIPNARKHDYLLVTHKSGPTQGQPLSRSSYVKTLKSIAAAVPELARLHGHGLRHSWNHRFSEQMDQMVNPPSAAEQEKMRSYLQGWKEGSGTAAIYTKRHTQAKSMEASLKLQAGMARIPENLNDD